MKFSVALIAFGLFAALPIRGQGLHPDGYGKFRLGMSRAELLRAIDSSAWDVAGATLAGRKSSPERGSYITLHARDVDYGQCFFVTSPAPITRTAKVGECDRWRASIEALPSPQRAAVGLIEGAGVSPAVHELSIIMDKDRIEAVIIKGEPLMLADSATVDAWLRVAFDTLTSGPSAPPATWRSKPLSGSSTSRAVWGRDWTGNVQGIITTLTIVNNGARGDRMPLRWEIAIWDRASLSE